MRTPVDRESEQARKERLIRVAACLNKFQAVREEVSQAERSVREYERRRPQVHGWVWLFLRKPAVE